MNLGKTWIVLANLVSILFLAGIPSEGLSQDTEWRRLTEQGNALSEKGQFAEAEKALLSALAEAQKFDSEDAHLATSQNNLAALYHAQGR
ncbi:MAG TPA: tetratricopeptide repeat protein, partial [Terriglobia bacterium]|nr:tetratricopeptide repeat protein [Terriglobia bacterium]